MNYEEYEFAEFMAKLEQKGKEASEDFNKLSPQNKEKVINAIKVMFGIDIVKTFFSHNSH